MTEQGGKGEGMTGHLNIDIVLWTHYIQIRHSSVLLPPLFPYKIY